MAGHAASGSSGPEDLPYRLGVGVMLLDDRGRVFVAQRIDTSAEAWQMPQGGIDEGEDPLKAAYREMKEEIGTDEAEVLAETDGWVTYDLPRKLQPRVWGGKYRGQKQKWYAMLFRGREEDIDLEAHDPEFSEWAWSEIEDLPRLIVPFKQPLYERLVEEFRPVVERLRANRAD